MKELFNKLSNLFSFGKEHRLVNEGETPAPVPDTIQEGEAVDAIDTSQSPEEPVKKVEAEAGKMVKADDSNLNKFRGKVHSGSAVAYETGLETEATEGLKKGFDLSDDEPTAVADADINIKNTPTITPSTPKDIAMENKISDTGLVGAINQGVAGDIFADKPVVADAEYPTMDLSDDADTGFEKGIDLSGEGEEGEGKPDETLVAAAHEAGLETEATEGLKKGFDLSEPTIVADAGGKKEDIDFNTMPPMDLSDGSEKKNDTQQASASGRKPSQ